MKKEVFVFLLIVLSLSASAEIIYDGWVVAGEPFYANNETFLAYYIEEDNTTLVLLPEGISTAIYADFMDCTEEWLYTICQSGQKFQINGYDVPPSTRSKDIVVSLHIKINKTEAGVEMKRDPLPEKVFVGDVLDIKTTLSKVGPAEISNFSFREAWPGFFVESFSSACAANAEEISFYTKKMDKDAVCVYRVTAQRETVSKNNGSLNYFVLEKSIKKDYLNQITIASSPVSMSIDYNKTLDLNKEGFVSVSVSASGGSQLKELRLVFQEGIIVNASGFSENNNKYVLQNPTAGTYNLNIRSKRSGNISFNASLSYLYRSVLNELKKEYFISVSGLEFEISLFKRENISIIRLSNTENIFFKNIKIYAGGHLFELPLLEKNRYKEFSLQTADAPSSIALTYQTEFGQLISENRLLTISEEKKEENIDTGEKTKSRGAPFSVKLSNNAFLVILLFVFLLLFALFIKSRPKKSRLDEEIEEIKKNNNV